MRAKSFTLNFTPYPYSYSCGRPNVQLFLSVEEKAHAKVKEEEEEDEGKVKVECLFIAPVKHLPAKQYEMMTTQEVRKQYSWIVNSTAGSRSRNLLLDGLGARCNRSFSIAVLMNSCRQLVTRENKLQHWQQHFLFCSNKFDFCCASKTGHEIVISLTCAFLNLEQLTWFCLYKQNIVC
ncbi:hypothetical protein ACJMK2_014095 [Sinanodonta woodiana]|uniref:Uncharacterized protein n=1 Tax=Sinanodonta woodiana TaxID=1069815 RepID=A0ABD3UZJ6_SINWO